MYAYKAENPEVKSKPLVSVIIPTHNRARLLQEAIASVLTQEGQGEVFDMEVIVVDDASSDETPQVVQQYKQIKYMRLNENHGEGGTRNVGIKASRGKYLAFVDDDDLMLPQRLQLQVPVMERNPEVGVVYSQNIIRGVEVKKWWPDAIPAPSGNEFDKAWPDPRRAPSGDVFAVLLKEEYLSMDTLLVRRVAFEKAGYFADYPTQAHYDMFLRLAFHVPFKFVPGNVAINRVNAEGVFHVRLVSAEGYGAMLPLVVERAIAMLPDTSYSRRLRAEVHVALVPRLLCMLERIEDVAGKGAYARIVLQSCPWLLTESSSRESLVTNAHYLARETAAPIASVRAVCKEIRAAWEIRGLKDWVRMRLFLSRIWMAVAQSLGFRLNPYRAAAAYAAMRAVVYSPLNLCSAFPKIMFRLIVGARAYSQLAVLKRRIS